MQMPALSYQEIWLPVQGFPKYEASYYSGQIRNVRTGHTLKPTLNSYKKHEQYYRVTLYRQNGKGVESTKRYVHRIVAAAHLAGQSNERWQVDHGDGDTANNSGLNLEWVTPKENCRRARERSLRQRQLDATNAYNKWLRGEPGGCPF